jgi:hypothetical protein
MQKEDSVAPHKQYQVERQEWRQEATPCLFQKDQWK